MSNREKQAGLAGIAWYCSDCGAKVWHEEGDTAEELPQEGYWRVYCV